MLREVAVENYTDIPKALLQALIELNSMIIWRLVGRPFPKV